MSDQELPGESRSAAADYQRYLLREVYNDGAVPRKVVQMAQKQVKLSKNARQHVLRSKKIAVQTLRSTGDEMTSQQAQRDLDSYWGKESRKYRAQDVRSHRRPAASRSTMSVPHAIDPPASHHSQYHFVKKTNNVADPRAEGAVPWDASWRRLHGASSQPLEQYDTQVQGRKKVATQGLRQTAKVNRDMPAFPGSFDSLLKKMRASDLSH